MVLITLVHSHSIVIVCGHKNLRTGTLTGNLLLLIECVPDRGSILLKHQLIYRRQIGRVVTDRVLNKQNSLHAKLENIVLGIHTILNELDDGNNQVGRVIPAEYIVNIRGIGLFNLAINLLREVCQKHHRRCRRNLLHLVREGVYIHLTDIVHRNDKVKMVCALDKLKCLNSRLYTGDRWRVTKVELRVLLCNLNLQTTILLKGVAVITIAHKQYSTNPSTHQLRVISALLVLLGIHILVVTFSSLL